MSFYIKMCFSLSLAGFSCSFQYLISLPRSKCDQEIYIFIEVELSIWLVLSICLAIWVRNKMKALLDNQSFWITLTLQFKLHGRTDIIRFRMRHISVNVDNRLEIFQKRNNVVIFSRTWNGEKATKKMVRFAFVRAVLHSHLSALIRRSGFFNCESE